MQEFKDNPEVQNSFFVVSAKSFVDDSESIRPDSFSTGKNKGIDIVDKRIYFFVADELLCLIYFVMDIGLQDTVKGSFE